MKRNRNLNLAAAVMLLAIACGPAATSALSQQGPRTGKNDHGDFIKVEQSLEIPEYDTMGIIMMRFQSEETYVARLIIALMVSLGAGFWGFVILFSDNNADWLYYASVFATHFLPSLLVGVLVPSRWYVCALTAWGALLLGALGFAAYMLGVTGASLDIYFLFLASIPAVALLGGFAGSKLVSKHSRSSAT